MFPLAWDQTAAADGLGKGKKGKKDWCFALLRFGHEDTARCSTLTYAPGSRNISKCVCVRSGLGACPSHRPPHCRWPKSDSYKLEDAQHDGYLWAVKWVKAIFCGIWVQPLSLPFFILTLTGHLKKQTHFQDPTEKKGKRRRSNTVHWQKLAAVH